MARQLRIEFNNAFYHITSRGNLRGKIFYEDGDRRAYNDKTGKKSFVDTDDTLSYFSSKKADALKKYKAFVEAAIGGEENPFKNVETGIILGGKIFKAKIKRLIDKIKDDEEIPQVKKLRMNVPIDKVIKTCCVYYGKKQDELLRRGKDKLERKIAIYLSKMLSGRKNKEVGDIFGIKGPAVSECIKAIEVSLDKENRLKKELEHLKNIINEK